MLDDTSLQRYARQLLLAEIGEPGQERLCSATATIRGESSGVRDVCAEYLSRAGVKARDGGELTLTLPTLATIDDVAGRPELREAAAWLLGSLHAVEAIKYIVGAGHPGVTTPPFALSTETD